MFFSLHRELGVSSARDSERDFQRFLIYLPQRRGSDGFVEGAYMLEHVSDGHAQLALEDSLGLCRRELGHSVLLPRHKESNRC